MFIYFTVNLEGCTKLWSFYTCIMHNDVYFLVCQCGYNQSSTTLPFINNFIVQKHQSTSIKIRIMVRLLLPTVMYDLGLCAPCTVSHSFGKSLLYYTAWENKLIPWCSKNRRECLVHTVCACVHPMQNLETTVHVSVLHNHTLEH